MQAPIVVTSADLLLSGENGWTFRAAVMLRICGSPALQSGPTVSHPPLDPFLITPAALPARPHYIICFRACDLERVDVGIPRFDALWPTEISLSKMLTACFLTVSRAVLSTLFAHGALIDRIAFSVCVCGSRKRCQGGATSITVRYYAFLGR